MVGTAEKIHAFEAAGLGLAPFRFVGMETAADRAYVQRQRESDGMIFTTNHATSCDYCGQGIKNAYRVQSADGKSFKVGCDCIRKTGDRGLIRVVTEEESEKRRAKTKERRLAKIEREKQLLHKFLAGGCESLRAMPHPKGRNGSAWDYVDWCVSNRFYGESVLAMIESAN